MEVLKRGFIKYMIFVLTSIIVSNNISAQNFNSGYSDIDGIKMYYEIHGFALENDSVSPLLLIHGGGFTIESTFCNILPSLSKDHKEIAVELQAHGHTSDRNAPESFEQDADDVAALLNNLKIKKASFFGFSNGGNTAIQIAIRHPQIGNKLILASTFYKRNGLIPGFFEGMKQATIKDMPQPLKDAFLKINSDSSRLLTMFNKDKERMLNFKDWKDEDIHSIKSPALIINGDHDVILPVHAIEMSRLITNSRLMILPAAHGSYIGAVDFSSIPDTRMIEVTAEIINDFLNNDLEK